MNLEATQLRTDVFGCDHCVDLGVFTRSPTSNRLYKFPPIIGAQCPAPLLFVGINPRRSGTNLKLHDLLMESREAFAQLAENRQANGRAYISKNGEEDHYHCHATVVESVFGSGTLFESKAAVTELYLCANESGAALLDRGRSRCSERFLQRVTAIVKPQVIVAVGLKVQNHLTTYFCHVINSPVVLMKHPRHMHGQTNAEKLRYLQTTIDEVRGILGHHNP